MEERREKQWLLGGKKEVSWDKKRRSICSRKGGLSVGGVMRC